jgi:hypothetical protein
VRVCEEYGQCREHGQFWEHIERAFSAGHDNEMSLVKKTDSTRILHSVPNEDGVLDHTIKTMPERPRVLPGRKLSENGASSIKSAIAAATASASGTRTDSFASTSSSTRSFCHVEREQPEASVSQMPGPPLLASPPGVQHRPSQLVGRL